jgi:hypothetical protein
MMMSIRETGRCAWFVFVAIMLFGCDSRETLPHIKSDDNAATLNRVIDVYEAWLTETNSSMPQLPSMGDGYFVLKYYQRELNRYKVLGDRIGAETSSGSGTGGAIASYIHRLCLAQQHAIELYLAEVGRDNDDEQSPYIRQIEVNATSLENAILLSKLRLGRDLGV